MDQPDNPTAPPEGMTRRTASGMLSCHDPGAGRLAPRQGRLESYTRAATRHPPLVRAEGEGDHAAKRMPGLARGITLPRHHGRSARVPRSATDACGAAEPVAVARSQICADAADSRGRHAPHGPLAGG